MSSEIESLDQEARGVTHHEGKAIFVDGALPGERVTFSVYRKKPSYAFAQLSTLEHASPSRTTPRCPHFGLCGGCRLQHMEPQAQVAAKQRLLEDSLWHIGRVRADELFAPIHGPSWGYRYRARLSVRHVEKKGGVLVGFHERKSSFIADMHQCEILPPRIGQLIDPLRAMLSRLSQPERLPQIEVSLGEEANVLVLRVLETLSEDDQDILRAFADAHCIQWWLQTGGPESAQPFYPLNSARLSYRLPEFNIEMPFHPTEFTQVNPAVNRVLVRRALRLLDPQPGERIADWFCGLGNFSLPIARQGASVVGFEGSKGLVKRAQENSAHNGLQARTEFKVANLFECEANTLAAEGRFDKWLVDPPRDGAIELVKALPDAGSAKPGRIVYVSCNPGTLARDAAVLVGAKGYRLAGAGVVNMFPHTAHVESIALFIRN